MIGVCAFCDIDKTDKIGDRRLVIHFNLHKVVAMKYAEAVTEQTCSIQCSFLTGVMPLRI